MEGSLSKYLFETAHNVFNYADVNARELPLVQYDIFYTGKI